MEIVTEPDFALRTRSSISRPSCAVRCNFSGFGLQDAGGSIPRRPERIGSPRRQQARHPHREDEEHEQLQAIAAYRDRGRAPDRGCWKRDAQIKQETRRWDDNKDASFAMRSKENAQDYRYFPSRTCRRFIDDA